MSASRHMLAAAAILVAGWLCTTGQAAEGPGTGMQLTQLEAPKAASEESPFGGPPPMKRGKKNSINCRTETLNCTIKPSQPLGTPCSCQQQGGGAIKGIVVE